MHKEREDRLKPEDKRMVFTNPVALDEDTANESGNADQPKESQAQPGEEPEEVVVHTPETEKSEPLLSAILDYEDGKKSDESKCTYNRPFPSYCEPHYESEAKCKALHMKVVSFAY